MNNPNPFLPQGSLAEQKNQKRARLKTAVYSILGVNFALVAGVLLIQGCGKDPTKTSDAGTNAVPPLPDNVGVASSPTNSSTGTNSMPSDLAATTPAPSNSAPVISATPISTPTTSSTVTTPSSPSTIAPLINVPTLTTSLPTTPTGTTTEYVVAKGDSFSTIAKKTHVSSKAIIAANPGVVPTKLKVGQKLQIPAASATMMASASTESKDSTAAGVYVVKAHDTLTKIAHVNGTTVKALRAENHLKTDSIRVGDKLKLPVKGVSSASADTAPMAIPSAPVIEASNVTTPVTTH
jgi:LysM repeat protein